MKAKIISVTTIQRRTRFSIEAQDGQRFFLEFLDVPKEWIPNYIEALIAITDEYFTKSMDIRLVDYVDRKMACNNFGTAFSWGDQRDVERDGFGYRIKELRLQMNMDAKTLAARAGVTPANMCRIEQGSYSPGLNVLLKIADALNCKLDLIPLDNE